MSKFDNGGANAIKGFNYQKAVIVLIAVLHYLDETDFTIHVETEDDIVVTVDGIKTYIQVKSMDLGVSQITQRPDNKDSIIEKNLANGEDASGNYKIVTPNFSYQNKHLTKAEAVIITDGAEVFAFNTDTIEAIKKKLPGLQEVKLNKSRIAVTSFKAGQKASLDSLIGIMARKGIPVDNSHGMASLRELCLEIDQRSEEYVQSTSDYGKKMFTKRDLQRILRHSEKVKHYEDILTALGYPLAKQVELKRRNATIGALHGSSIDLAREHINLLDLMNIAEKDVIVNTIENIAFNAGTDEMDKEAIVISAYSQVLFERSQA